MVVTDVYYEEHVKSYMLVQIQENDNFRKNFLTRNTMH